MQGIVIYEGPSQIDGGPIVCIATGLRNGSPNAKTGEMVQIYFIHAEMKPWDAAQAGLDRSICGTCRHRGSLMLTEDGTKNVGRSCYVTLFQGPRVVYEAYKRGAYPKVSVTRAASLLKGKFVRFGAYGDPGSIPSLMLRRLVRETAGHTGYTHLWRERPELRKLFMASCDTDEERSEAKALGFRTFRVRTREEPVLSGEGQCPASSEMGKVTTCLKCMLCDGQRSTRRADITLVSHGVGAVHFNRQAGVAA